MKAAFAMCLTVLGLAASGAAAQPTGAIDPSFEPIAAVLLHPRCANCHPRGDVPLQGEDGHRHAQNVVRGEHDHGAPTLQCATCHQKANYAASGVPGAFNPKEPDTWRLAPLRMGWNGMTPLQLCESLKATAAHDGKSIRAAMDHMRHDPLVTWAWKPGGDRKAPPGDHDALVAHLDRWLAAEARCSPVGRP